MDTIYQIRNDVRETYFGSLAPLTLKFLNGTIWKDFDEEFQKETLLVIHKGRLEKAKYEENRELEKRGYIVVRGLTLQEWQDYFCDIFDKYKLIKKVVYTIDEITIKDIFTKEQYNKLVTVVVYANKYIKIKEQHLLNRKYTFPPVQENSFIQQ